MRRILAALVVAAGVLGGAGVTSAVTAPQAQAQSDRYVCWQRVETAYHTGVFDPCLVVWHPGSWQPFGYHFFNGPRGPVWVQNPPWRGYWQLQIWWGDRIVFVRT